MDQGPSATTVDSIAGTGNLLAMLDVAVEWYEPDDGDWSRARQVYAYLHPATQELLYIGKADFCSPRERWNGHKRDGLFASFQDDFGLEECDTILGEFVEVAGVSRLSVELLEDVETLLLWHIRPPGNVQFPDPMRSGLRVTCEGKWPLEEKVFEDPG